MKRILGYTLLTGAALAVLGPLAHHLTFAQFIFVVGSSVLIALAVVKGMEWTS